MPMYESETPVKQNLVLEIGTAYTKLGFSGEFAPRHIIKSEILCKNTSNLRKIHDYNNEEDLYDMLVEFVHMIYFRYALLSPKDKPLVLVESLMCTTTFRATLAKVLFHHYEVSSVLFLPSHLVSTATLGIETALVLDVGYSEALAIPICHGYPVLHAWEALPIASHAIHQNIHKLLANDNLGVSNIEEETLEDIKVRCCFVTKSERAQQFTSPKPSLKACPEVIYPLGGHKLLKISGKLRETAYEILFEEDVDGRNLATIILDALLKVNLDLRIQLAANILITGGTAMAPGFKARLKEELHKLLTTDKYKRLQTEKFQLKFHNPPSKDNYTAWLGGAIYGNTDLVSIKSLTKWQYFKENRVPDWVNLRDCIRSNA